MHSMLNEGKWWGKTHGRVFYLLEIALDIKRPRSHNQCKTAPNKSGPVPVWSHNWSWKHTSGAAQRTSSRSWSRGTVRFSENIPQSVPGIVPLDWFSNKKRGRTNDKQFRVPCLPPLASTPPREKNVLRDDKQGVPLQWSPGPLFIRALLIGGVKWV